MKARLKFFFGEWLKASDGWVAELLIALIAQALCINMSWELNDRAMQALRNKEMRYVTPLLFNYYSIAVNNYRSELRNVKKKECAREAPTDAICSSQRTWCFFLMTSPRWNEASQFCFTVCSKVAKNINELKRESLDIHETMRGASQRTRRMPREVLCIIASCVIFQEPRWNSNETTHPRTGSEHLLLLYFSIINL